VKTNQRQAAKLNPDSIGGSQPLPKAIQPLNFHLAQGPGDTRSPVTAEDAQGSQGCTLCDKVGSSD
jgi:hypothetical protein